MPPRYDSEKARTYGEIWTIEEEVRRAAAEALRGVRGRILDAGCGNGALLTRLPAGAFVVALDESPEMLAEARRRNPLRRFVRGDLARLPFRRGAFAAAVAVNALWTLPEASARTGVAEMARAAEAVLFDYRNRANPGIYLRRTRDAENPFHGVPLARARDWLRGAGRSAWRETPIYRPWSRGALGALLSRIPGWTSHVIFSTAFPRFSSSRSPAPNR